MQFDNSDYYNQNTHTKKKDRKLFHHLDFNGVYFTARL